jgi:hypothetical protein
MEKRAIQTTQETGRVFRMMTMGQIREVDPDVAGSRFGSGPARFCPSRPLPRCERLVELDAKDRHVILEPDH